MNRIAKYMAEFNCRDVVRCNQSGQLMMVESKIKVGHYSDELACLWFDASGVQCRKFRPNEVTMVKPSR